MIFLAAGKTLNSTAYTARKGYTFARRKSNLDDDKAVIRKTHIRRLEKEHMEKKGINGK